MADGGGGSADDGGGSAEWLPIFYRVEAMVSRSQSQAEALAADRARLEAADRVQRESWEAARRLQRSVEELQAAAREKDAEMDRLRAEAADAKKKLQADAGRKMRWEAAYVDLLLGANQKLAELRDGDKEDTRTCGATPNSKGVERCPNLNQNNVHYIATDLSAELRKLKQAYTALSSKKDKEVSTLLSEKDSTCNHLSIIQQDYAELLKKKEVEAAQATAATQKLKQNLDSLNVLVQRKHDLIIRMRAEAGCAEYKLQKMQSRVKERDDEIQRLKGRHPESVQKCNKDISDTHKRSRSDDPGVMVSELENNGLGKSIGDKIPQTKTMENNGQDETTRKRRRASSMSNDDQKGGRNEDADKNGEKFRGSDVDDDDDDDDDDDVDDDGDDSPVDDDDDVMEYMGVVLTWSWSSKAPGPLCSMKLQVSNGQSVWNITGDWGQYVKAVKDSLVDQPDKLKKFARFLGNFEDWRVRYVARTMKDILEGQPKLIRQFNGFLPDNCQIEVKEEEKQQPEHQGGVPGPLRQLPSAPESESAAAAAGLILLSEEEQLQRERV